MQISASVDFLLNKVFKSECMQRFTRHSLAAKMRFTSVALACVLAAIVSGLKSSQDQAYDAKERVLNIANELYGTLRNIAFPAGNVLSTGLIENRFLMLMPGKVLNYFDYFPGKEYTKFIQDYNTRRRESVVPPHVMEKWFDIADTIPSPDPLIAQDTGKSLANVYQSILHEIKLKGLQKRTQDVQHFYNQGSQFLNSQTSDPENLKENVTRLALYERYRDQYNDRKLNMEDQIEQKRQNLGSLDYELWFQRHYPSLQSRVESAYTKWMVFGQKELVELNIAYMDTGSSGQIVEEARAAMRASGVQSLDRTRTVYPVSFEPSDWYKYLLPQEQRPSRDQLQIMLGKLQSRLDAIEATIDYVNHIPSSVSNYIHTLIANLNTTKSKTKADVQSYIDSMYKCMTDKTGIEDDCKRFGGGTDSTIKSLLSEANAFARSAIFSYLSQPNGGYTDSLRSEANRLKGEMSRIYSLLGEASPYLGGLTDASPLAIANLTDEYKDDQWLQFEYNSASSSSRQDDSYEYSSSSTSGGFHFFFFGGGGSSYSQSEERTHEYALATANLTVKGELLRVNIKRPWFKPEIFDDPGLTYLESNDEGDKTFVSPGRSYGNEKLYVEAVNGNQQRRFKLPEYATSFLLARNIQLEFDGLDYATSSYYMSQITKSSGGGGFLFFHVHHSETKTKQVSHVQASKTASGMKIKIPGAQLIGYYTETLPKFPQDQN